MKLKFLILSLIFGGLLLGCSNQVRESDPQLSGEEMMAMLDQLTSGASANGSSAGNGVAEALTYKDDPKTTIFFADAPGPMGPVASVLAVDYLDFIRPGEDLWYGNVTKAQLYFLDSPSTTDRQNGLVIGIVTGESEQYQYYGLSGQGAIVDGQFVVEMTSPTGARIVLRSFDTDGDDLLSVIQLQVYEVDASGNEIYIGKFSTLVGYQQ